MEAQSSPTSFERIKSSIVDITYGDYVKVVMGDFSSIVIAKDITVEECQNARELIMAEFAEATGDLDYISSVLTKFKIMRLNLKQLSMALAFSILNTAYDPDIFDYLKEQRIISRDTAYPKTTSELDSILALINNEIELLNIEISEAEEKPKETSEDTRDDDTKKREAKKGFIKLLASVSQFVKYNVTFDTNCAVVAEYVNRLREHNEKIESSKK